MAKNQNELRHLTDAEAAYVTDGERVFLVPKEHAPAIIGAVPSFRYSFEHLGGRRVGHANKE